MVFGRKAVRKREVESPMIEPRPAMTVVGEHGVLGTPLTGPFPDGTEQLVLAMGCFWGVERLFWQLDGVYTTAAGYSGGHTAHPRYDDLAGGQTGHAESVLVVYDPTITSLERLLAVFWENHRPTTPSPHVGFGSQYRSAIFATTPDQLSIATASRDHYQSRLRESGYTKIHTEVREAGEFYYAEDRYQQYMHKNPRALCTTGFCQVSYD